ncbi:MAG: hypothetical protein R3314_00820 [Longimicrobiales bacterium]|nr:hypothetical protein [Longimicrobiales bacterium]
MWYVLLAIVVLAAVLLVVRRQRVGQAAGVPRDELVERVRAAVLEGPGATPAALRHEIDARAAAPAAVGAPDVPSELRELVDKVALRAYAVTDEDIAELQRAGYTDDAIFEVIASAAVGAGTARLRQGLEALEQSRGGHHAP